MCEGSNQVTTEPKEVMVKRPYVAEMMPAREEGVY